VILDTTFLIDLEREVRRRSPGRAAAVLDGRGTDGRFAVCEVASGELAEGYPDSERRSFDLFMRHFEGSRSTGRRQRSLDRGMRCAHARPLVTRNTGHFDQVPELVVISY
jgi:predicted nucleic acid-binding protein